MLNKSLNLRAPVGKKSRSAQLKGKKVPINASTEKHKDNVGISPQGYPAAVHTIHHVGRVWEPVMDVGTAEEWGHSKVSLRTLGFYTEVRATEPHTNNHKIAPKA